MLDKSTIDSLRKRSFDLRIDNLTAIAAAGNGHPGGTLSVMDILQTLYFAEMKHRPTEPHWPERDRLDPVQGSRRAGALQRTRARRLLLARSAADAAPPRQPAAGAPRELHAAGHRGLDRVAGTGTSIAIGLALASKLDGDKFRVYSIIGDGESEEGQIWEAAMAAPKYKLDNLVVILDHNKGQIDGFVKDVMDLDPIADKWRAFNWHVISIDGHDYRQIGAAFDEARATKGKPTFILADTVKGKGVSFMEGKIGWHGVAPTKEQLEQAVAELRAAKEKL